MKFVNYILVLLAIAAGFASCDELDKTTAADEEDILAPVLNAVGDISIKDNNKEEEVTFTWSSADFGYTAMINYSIHAVYAGEEGEQDIVLFSGINETSYATTKDVLNVKFCTATEEGGLGIAEYATATVGFYVTATVGTDYEIVRSAGNINSTVTTAQAVVAAKGLYIPGSHQGWAPAAAQMIFESAETDVYIGYLDLNTESGSDVEFKFTSVPSWEDGTNYGGALEALDTDGGAGNLKTASGFYKAKVDLVNMKAVLTKMDQVGLMGSFNNWADDEVMDYDWATKTYSATITLEAKGEFKVRFNSNWDYNMGGDINDLTEGGANIVVEEAGTYLVKFFYNYETYKYCLSYEKQ